MLRHWNRGGVRGGIRGLPTHVWRSVSLSCQNITSNTTEPSKHAQHLLLGEGDAVALPMPLPSVTIATCSASTHGHASAKP